MDTEVLSSDLWYEKFKAQQSYWLILNDNDSIAGLSKGVNSHLVLRFPISATVQMGMWSNSRPLIRVM